MTLDREDILEFIERNPRFFLATCQGDTPFVRAMMACEVGARGILFNTSTDKDLYAQLIANPKVELCFFNPGDDVQIRLSGAVEFETDAAVKSAVVDKFPFLQNLVARVGMDRFQPLYLKRGKATLWTAANKHEPKVYVDVAF